MAIWHAMCEHFLGFSRGFTNFSGNWSSHFMGNLDIFLKDYIANRCKSTKLHQNRYARASSAACKASKRQQASLTYTRDNVHSGRRSIMRGPDAPCFALRYATKRSWRDAHWALLSMGLRRVRRTCTAARARFKGGLRSKPPGAYVRIVMWAYTHTSRGHSHKHSLCGHHTTHTWTWDRTIGPLFLATSLNFKRLSFHFIHFGRSNAVTIAIYSISS